jgi:hypothetical protein
MNNIVATIVCTLFIYSILLFWVLINTDQNKLKSLLFDILSVVSVLSIIYILIFTYKLLKIFI